MTQIAFTSQTTGRSDNPWLATSLDVRGADADTLRAHAAAAIYGAPLLLCEATKGMPSARRWIEFDVEGRAFQARFLQRDFSIEVRLAA